MLALANEHLLDRRSDEIRLLKLDEVAAAGGNHLSTIGRETDFLPHSWQ